MLSGSGKTALAIASSSACAVTAATASKPSSAIVVDSWLAMSLFFAAPRTRLRVQAMERGTIQLQRADSVKSRRYNWACLIWQKLRCVKAPPLVRFIVTNAAAVRAS